MTTVPVEDPQSQSSVNTTATLTHSPTHPHSCIPTDTLTHSPTHSSIPTDTLTHTLTHTLTPVPVESKESVPRPHSPTPSLVPGSLECPYRLAIVGGGPAGTSVLVRAVHLAVSHELCSFGAVRDDAGVLQKQAGVCIFDSAPPERFGGGRLQDYIINSNTFGGKFVTNIVQDKPNVIPPEKASGTILESLEKTVIAQALGKYGTDVAPLNDIGMFLVEIGHQVKKLIDHYHESSKYESRTEVTQLQQSECKQFWKITSLNIKTQMMSITYAFQVVLATGGSQKLPRLSPSSRNSKLMSSDEVCTSEGVTSLAAKLEKKDKKKIVIIGGSHSAFSAAWICLNKLTLFTSEFQIYIIHRSAIKVFYATKREADKDKYHDYDTPNKCGQIHPFGGLRGDAKSLYRSIRSGKESKIRLLCTGADGSSHQTMSNKLQDEAHVIIWACGYGANTSFKVLDHLGNKIKLKMDRGQVEVNDLAMVMQEASIKAQPHPTVIVSATTTTTPLSAVAAALNNNTPIPLVDPESVGESVATTVATVTTPVLRRSPSSVNVEDMAPKPIPNLLGTGLGYGLSLGNNSTETAKADGVAVYLKRGATLILSHVVGPKVFGDTASTWEQHVAINLKRSAMISLELQVQERQQREREKGLGLALDSPNSKGYMSPKKTSRGMVFDPSSPSNASIGIGAGIGFPSANSATKRNISTAPANSRIRQYNKSNSGCSDSSVSSSSRSGSRTSGAVAPKPLPKPNTTRSKNSSDGVGSSSQSRSQKKKASMGGNTVGAESKRISTASGIRRTPHNEIENAAVSSEKESQNSQAKTPPGSKSETIAEPNQPSSVNNESVEGSVGGVSILSGSDDVDDDPPPSYRSVDDQDVPIDSVVMLPQVPGVSRSKNGVEEDTVASGDSGEGVEGSKKPPVDAPTINSQAQKDTLSRLCQPKSFSRAPSKNKSNLDIPNHVVTKTAKATSQFSFDLPEATMVNNKEFKGGYTKVNHDALSHVGSDNLHIDMLQPCDTNNTLLRPDASTPSTSRSSSSVAVEVEDSKSFHCLKKAQRSDDSTRPKSKSSRRSKKSPSQPPMSPIVKKKEMEKNFVKDDSAKQQTGGRTSGPSLSDLLWAEKRAKPQTTPPRQPSKPALCHSPIINKSSPNSARAQSSGGHRGRYHAAGSVSKSLDDRRDGSAGGRSPVPTSAPSRSKRIMSQSLNGPPVSLLKLPSLQEPVAKCSMFKKISKPILFVKHDVFAKSQKIPTDYDRNI